MSVLDQLATELTPPADPGDIDAWLDARESALAATMRAVLRTVIAEALEGYQASLRAAGDEATFDGPSRFWGRFVKDEVGETLGGMYLAGGLSAFVHNPAADQIPAFRARVWASSVNESALAYQAAATNRIVGASDVLWGDVRRATVTGLQAGMSNEDLKAEVERITGFSEARADTIARTETVAAYNGGDYEGAVALGEYGPIEKSWLAAHDARTRPSHVEADGQTVPFGEKFTVGGVAMDRPHAPGAPAAEVVNCRCVLQLLYAGDTRPDGIVVQGPENRTPGYPFTVETPERAAFREGATTDVKVIDKRAKVILDKHAAKGHSPKESVRYKRGKEDPNNPGWSGEYGYDSALQSIGEVQGFDALPALGSAADVDAIVANGGTEVFRGFGGLAGRDQFVSGAYEPGLGIYGNGFYSSTMTDTAGSYADFIEDGPTRMVLRPDAKILDIWELDEAIRPVRWVDGSDDVAVFTQQTVSDQGRAAATLGYDAIRIRDAGMGRKADGTREDYIVIFNRGALTVDESTLTRQGGG